MAKKRRSVSLSEENDEFLSNHPNASQLVNELVTQYRTGGMVDQTVREFRKQQLQAEVQEHESEKEWAEKKAELKREELQKLNEQEQKQQNRYKVQLQEAKEALEHTPRDAENPAIQKWAKDLGIEPDELVDELRGDDE